MPLLITLSVGKDVRGCATSLKAVLAYASSTEYVVFHNYSVVRAFPAYCTSKKCAQEIFDTFVRMSPTL